RALFLDPGDDDARADLLEVRRGNVDKLEGENDEGGTETLARILAPLPGGTAAALFIAFWIAAWTLVGIRIFRPDFSWVSLAARRSAIAASGLLVAHTERREPELVVLVAHAGVQLAGQLARKPGGADELQDVGQILQAVRRRQAGGKLELDELRQRQVARLL